MVWYFDTLAEAVLWLKRELNRRSPRHYYDIHQVLDLAKTYVESRDGGYWVAADAPDEIVGGQPT